MKVEIWSDVVCPWCYIGKRRFEAALARFTHAEDVEVVWRAFELDPGAPAVMTESLAQHLATKYGMPLAQAQRTQEDMTRTAAAEGLDFHFEAARTGNTFDAHRLLAAAAEHGVQGALKERLLRAYFTEGAPISDPSTLERLAADAGLPEGVAAEVLADDVHGEHVRADERQAAAYGISGVPFFVVDERYGVSGAQPADVLLEVLETAWREAHPLQMVVATPSGAGSDAACADGSCAV